MSGNVTIIHHSLNAGEVSPRMVARQDQAKYPACCEVMLNWTPLVVGGAVLRPGSLFVTECKDVADHPIKRIRPFVAARHAAYTMEFGHEYVRFFFQGLPVGAPLELVTPYQDTDLPELFLVQSIDVCYLLHGLYPPHKITRISETEFVIGQVTFNPPATKEDEPTGANMGMGTLTPGATTGTGITFTAASAGFLDADVGRLIVAGSGRGIITAITTTTATVTITDAFASTAAIPATDWRLVLPAQTTLDITNDRTDIGQPVLLTAAIPAFRPTDVGKWITMFGGLLYIQVVISTTVVNALIRSKLGDISTSDPPPTKAWTMEVAAWSNALGYPTCGCFFQERFWLCEGLAVNGSVTGDYENFAKGANDDSAIARTISDDDVDAITWIKGDQSLKIGTFSGIYEASPTTQSGALTPSSFKIAPIDANGGARIQPIRVSPVLVYVDANKRELRQLAYDFASDKFQSAHLFRLAEHLIDGHFINEMAYAYSPDSTVYVVRDDGVLLALLYEQVESVIAWSRIQTDGEIKSCTVIPRPETGKDWVWWLVEREGGIYVEYLEPDHPSTGREWNELRTDSAVVAVPSIGGLVTGLDHLEGKTVWAVADGCLYNSGRDENGTIISTAVVTDGQIQLELLDPPQAISRVEVGLDIDARLVPIEPALPAQAGGPMIARGYAEIGVRIRKALGLTIRAYRVMLQEPGDENLVGEQLVYRKPYHPMDAPVPLQQGKKCVTNLGYDPFARIEVRQPLPFPAEVLNIIGRLHIGDRWDCGTYDDIDEFVPVGSGGGGGGGGEPCVDSTERGQTTLVPEIAFTNNSTKSGNARTEWSYISPTGELYTVIGDAACAGGNMAYNDTCMEVNHFTAEGGVTARQLVPHPDDSLPMNPPPIGSSDEPFYFSKHGQFGYYPVSGTRVFMDGLPAATNGWTLATYAKRDTHFFGMGISYGAEPDKRIGDYDAVSGHIIAHGVDVYSFALTLFNMTNGCATANFLYCLTSLISNSAIRAVKKLNRSDLTLAASFDLTGMTPRYMYAVDDNIIYIMTDEMALYYLKNFTTLVFVGSLGGTFNNTPFGGNQGFFTNGAFYWGSVGLSGFSTDIAKVAVACPDPVPLIASVTTAPTVAHGANLSVTWSDVLQPNVNDRLYLKSATDGVVFDSTPLSNQTPGTGAGSGTFNFAIPGGTTAGSYVIQYVSQNTSLVAQSAPFTVT